MIDTTCNLKDPLGAPLRQPSEETNQSNSNSGLKETGEDVVISGAEENWVEKNKEVVIVVGCVLGLILVALVVIAIHVTCKACKQESIPRKKVTASSDFVQTSSQKPQQQQHNRRSSLFDFQTRVRRSRTQGFKQITAKDKDNNPFDIVAQRKELRQDIEM